MQILRANYEAIDFVEVYFFIDTEVDLWGEPVIWARGDESKGLTSKSSFTSLKLFVDLWMRSESLSTLQKRWSKLECSNFSNVREMWITRL